MADRFPSPFEIQTPPGAEGWRELYTYSSLFSEDRREYEDGAFWFHGRRPLARGHDALGHDVPRVRDRVAVAVQHPALPDPARAGRRLSASSTATCTSARSASPTRTRSRRRVPQFMERAGFYFGNWDRLYDEWLVKIRDLVEEMERAAVRAAPAMRGPRRSSPRARGIGLRQRAAGRATTGCSTSGSPCGSTTSSSSTSGYAAYLDFFGFCKAAFPSIPDLAIAKMVAGVDVDLFRPDDELKQLARLAVEQRDRRPLHRRRRRARSAGPARRDEGGRAWIAEWEEAAAAVVQLLDRLGLLPLATRSGSRTPTSRSASSRDYIAKVRRGADLDRPVAALQAERDRIVVGVPRPARLRRGPRDLRGQARAGRARSSRTSRTTTSTSSTGRTRCSGARCATSAGCSRTAGFFAEADDVFLLRRHRGARRALGLLPRAGPSGPRRAARRTGRREIQRRRGIHQRAAVLVAAAGAGRAAGGRSPSRSRSCCGASRPTPSAVARAARAAPRACSAASPPRPASPRARPGSSCPPTRSARSQDGEILVAPLTAPSWAPVFGKIEATVTDVGGIMSHAAIVCREYGLPAVTGTAFGTKTIKTGQLLRVDGNTGKVTILTEAVRPGSRLGCVPRQLRRRRGIRAHRRAERRADPTSAPGTPMGELLRRYWYPIAFEPDSTRVPESRRSAAGRGLGAVQDALRQVRDHAARPARTAGRR